MFGIEILGNPLRQVGMTISPALRVAAMIADISELLTGRRYGIQLAFGHEL